MGEKYENKIQTKRHDDWNHAGINSGILVYVFARSFIN
jgi:hypothetical protein